MANIRREFLIEPAELQAMRNGMGITQAHAGEIVGGSMRAWQTYESGITPIPPSKLFIFKIAYAEHQKLHDEKMNKFGEIASPS